MSLLEFIPIQQAYAKIGLYGQQGSGKTRTASLIAKGLCKLEKVKKAAFIDSETGSDYMMQFFEANEIKLYRKKTRSLPDVIEIIRECESSGIKVLIIDSLTHVWMDLQISYKRAKRRSSLTIADWGPIKEQWREYVDCFLNSKVHIVVCGRGGFIYDIVFDEAGRMEVIKTGTKMKAEGEFEYEPSLVVEMEAVKSTVDEVRKIVDRKKRLSFKPKPGCRVINRAFVLKDRWDIMNGLTFDYPTFEDFLPHISNYSIGGEHSGVDTDRSSIELFDKETGETKWQAEKKEREIVLDEIKTKLDTKYDKRSKDGQRKIYEIFKAVFGTESFKRIEVMRLGELKEGYEKIIKIIDPTITTDQIKAIHFLFKSGMDIDDHDVIREQSGVIVGIEGLESMKNLTNKEASKIIDHLKAVNAESKESPAPEAVEND
jgi:hypothetical protein